MFEREKKMCDEEKNVAIIGRLFIDYGMTDKKRYQSYADEFQCIDTNLLMAAVKKVTQTSKFLPTKADIYEALKSLNQTAIGKKLYLDWDEAWGEIYKAMANIGPYRTPNWSTGEIKRVVDSVGWVTICGTEDRNLNTLRAQMREMYNAICKRKDEQSQNQNLLLNRTEYQTLDNNAYAARQAAIARSKAKLLGQGENKGLK